MGTASSSEQEVSEAIDSRKKVLDAEFERAAELVKEDCGETLVRIGSAAFGIWRPESDLDVAIGFRSFVERDHIIKTVLDKGIAAPGVKWIGDNNAILRLCLEGAAACIDLHVLWLHDILLIRAGSERCMREYTRRDHLRWLAAYKESEKLGLGIERKRKVYRHWVPLLNW